MLRNGLDPAVKAMALILSILLSKLKNYMSEKEVYSKESLK